MKSMIDDGQLKAKQPITTGMIRVLLGTALILLVPLLAMQFTDEVVWTPLDFAVAAALLAGTGAMYVLGARMLSNLQYRVALGVVLALALLLMWAELAVGLIGTRFAGT